jgi:hypothetical protein
MMMGRNQEFAFGDDGGSTQLIPSPAVMISGGAIGIGGGVGTTSSA